MILSKNDKFIIMHIPKTGGSTITNYFKKYNDCNSYTILWGNRQGIDHAHLSVSEIEQFCKIKTCNLTQYKWFAFVRNPYDRIYSAYTYLKLNPQFPFSSYEEFLISLKTNQNQYIHSRPLITFLNSEQISKYSIKILRLEHFQSHFLDLISLFHLPKTWKNFNISCPDLTKQFRYEDIYLNNPSCVQLIDDIYSDDFVLFRYPKYNLHQKKLEDFPKI
jgi:hypothetical protein